MDVHAGGCSSSSTTGEETLRGVATPSPAPACTATPTPASVAATSASVSINNAVSSPSVQSQLPQSSTHQSASGPRILSRNVNGTLVQTSVPQNEAELQLYRVMQRASLLGYYDTLLEMGGDDVQQLCDAGEEEFLEIMALVGMASKPLHVRRLQKALQEWLTNPSMFQTPVIPSNPNSKSNIPMTFPCISPRAQFPAHSQTQSSYNGPLLPLTPLPCRSSSPVVQPPSANTSTASTTFRHTPSPSASVSYPSAQSPGVLQVGTCESSCGSGTTSSPGGASGAPGSPTQPVPALLQSQVQRLSDAAERLAASLPPLDPKPHNIKKKICKNLEMVMAMSENDPRRMDEIRKYAAIYGRFDCKRKPEKPLTLHEVSVNEAAAQICKFVPALLTRRDELFPLARQVVRDSGYHYSKSQYISMMRPRENGEDAGDGDRVKRYRLDLEGESEDSTQAMLDVSNSTTKRRRSSSPVWHRKSNGVFNASPDASDSDTQFSFSNDAPPSLQDEGDADNSNEENDFNLKVIASRGDDIIAVANPALRMSPPVHINSMECAPQLQIKEETTDEKSES
ncbi:NGFI-A-binding protein homolog isoform X1 [Diprion similis]|uniref:NGFI-A-binding protein homolog isoform X1 n=1 Tax=Diprion similis TaxID=362088 RepID=UPI001EF815FB|nr:NGFI-A-binding protein homolog isoform X1 [Diprion similis]